MDGNVLEKKEKPTKGNETTVRNNNDDDDDDK